MNTQGAAKQARRFLVRAEGRIDPLDLDNFKYEISVTELS